MPKLYVRLRSRATPLAEGYDLATEWLIEEDDGRIRGHGEADFRGLSDLVDPGTDWLQNPANVIVTVPAEDVLSLSVEVPGRSAGQVRRALPFVVEEFVTTDIEAMHLACGEIRRGAPTRVCLIDRQLLDDWLACLALLGVRPGQLYSEADLLPVAAGQASVLLDGDRVLLRTPDQSAAVDRDNLALALGSLAAERAAIVHGTLEPLELGQLAQELEVVAPDVADTHSVLEFVAANWRDADAVNLLQGEYRARQQANPVWQRWRAVAALAAAWVGVALVSMTAQALYASHQADALDARSEALYREIFPAERRVINPQRQLRAKLGERAAGDTDGAGLLEFLGPLAANLGDGARIASFSYEEERGELAIDMFAPGFEALDQIKERLNGEGVAAEIVTAEKAGDGDEVRARVRLGGRR